MGIHFIIAILYLGWLTLAGAGLFAMLAWRKAASEPPGEAWISNGLGLGLGLQSTVLALTLLAGHRLVYGWLWASQALAVAGLLAFVFVSRRLLYGGFRRALSLARSSRASSVQACCAGALLLLFCLMARDAMRYPITGYDGVAIWNFKAKILFREGTLWTGAVTDPLRVHYHRNYPVLYPLALATLYRAMGAIDERAVKALYFALFLGLAMAVYGRVERRTGKPAAGVLAAFLTAGLPLWQQADHGVFNSGYTNLAMAFLSFLALAELDAWWQEDARASLALGAVFAGLCWETKNEGALFLAAALGAGALQAAAFRRHRHWRSIAALAALAAIALAVALPSILVARGLPNFYDEDYGGALSLARARAAVARLPLVAANLKEIALNGEAWGQFWIVYPVAAALGLRRRLRDANAFADAAIFLYVACVLAVFGLTPLHVDFHMKTALPRLMTQIYPFAVYRVACQGAESWDAIRRASKDGMEIQKQ